MDVIINSTKVAATVPKITLRLNDENTAEFSLPNTPENRALTQAIQNVTIKIEGQTKFTGILASPELHRNVIKCFCREKAVYYLDRGHYTKIYEFTPADTIFNEICSAAGVTYSGSAPNAESIRFDDAKPFYAAMLTVLHYGAEEVPAYGLGVLKLGRDSVGGSPQQFLDWWTSDLTFHVGFKGSNKGAVPILTIGQKRLDFTKMKDTVIGKAWKLDGTEITYTAGTGEREAKFTDRNAIGTVTLGNFVERKFEFLNEPIVSLPVQIDILTWLEKDLEEGDTITIKDEELNIDGDYRIVKAVITDMIVKCDLVKGELNPDDLLRTVVDADAQPAPAPTNLPPVEEKLLDATTEPPPGEVVAAIQEGTSFAGSASGGVWTKVLELTVPSESHDVYFLLFQAIAYPTTAGVANMFCWARLYNVTKGEYYPSAIGQKGVLGATNEQHVITYFFTIPKDVTGDELEVQVQPPTGFDAIFERVGGTGWGHSPHTHPTEVQPSYHQHNINEARHFNPVTDRRQALLEDYT